MMRRLKAPAAVIAALAAGAYLLNLLILAALKLLYFIITFHF